MNTQPGILDGNIDENQNESMLFFQENQVPAEDYTPPLVVLTDKFLRKEF